MMFVSKYSIKRSTKGKAKEIVQYERFL